MAVNWFRTHGIFGNKLQDFKATFYCGAGVGALGSSRIIRNRESAIFSFFVSSDDIHSGKLALHRHVVFVGTINNRIVGINCGVGSNWCDYHWRVVSSILMFEDSRGVSHWHVLSAS